MKLTAFKFTQFITLFALLLSFQNPVCGTEEEPDFIISRDQIERMREETIFAISFIQNNHYNRKSFDKIEASELINSFMKELDYTKLFYLKKDEKEIMERFGPTIKSTYLRHGDLYPVFEIFRIYRNNALARFAWIEKRLEGDFDFSTNETFRPDRSELGWPESQEVADGLWERRLKYELILELLDDETLDVAKARLQKRYDRSKKYLLKIEPYNVQDAFLDSYAGLYDPHTSFFSAEVAEEFNISISNKLEGIGAMLSDEDGYCTIRELIPGGPAEMSGLLNPGDKIIEVAQGEEEPVDVVDMKLSKVVQLIRGEKGSEVRLTILPPGTNAKKIVPLTRDEIKLTEKLASATIRELPDSEGKTIPIGVIELPSFYGDIGYGGDETSTTSEDVEELISKLEARNVKGIVLDLRKNGGGLLSEAIRLAGLFIPTGPVVQIKDMTGDIQHRWDEDKKVVYDGPLVILVSKNSASASEIVAGALQSIGRAVIVGDTTTHGKGTVQAPWPLERTAMQNNPFRKRDKKLGTVKVTIQKFYLPDGASTQLEGVKSDIVIPNTNDYREIGEADLDNAMPWDSIAPEKWSPNSVLPENAPQVNNVVLNILQNRSKQRIETMEEFSYLNEIIERFRERKEKKEYSLNLAIRKKEKEQDEEFSDFVDKERDRLAKKEYALKEILLDVSKDKEAQHQEKLKNATLPNGESKTNAYFQKRFYYQAKDSDKITDINVEYFDYEEALKHTDELKQVVEKEVGIEISEESMEKVLTTFKNSDRGADFVVEKTFADDIEGVTVKNIRKALPAFYTKMIEIDPDILLERPKLDIPLREALRVSEDLIEYYKTYNEPAIAVKEQEEKKDLVNAE